MKHGWFCADTARHSGSGLFSTPDGVWVAVTRIVDDSNPHYNDAFQSRECGFYVGPVIDHIANIPPRPWPGTHAPYWKTATTQDGPRDLHINGKHQRALFGPTLNPIASDGQRTRDLVRTRAYGGLPFEDDE
nr:hypothetical protein [Pandoravirus massiliensis]